MVRHRYLGLLVALALLVSELGSSPQAEVTAAGLIVEPQALELSVPLGERRTSTLRITNATSAAITPAIYEVHPERTTAELARERGSAGPARVGLPQQAGRIDAQLLADLRAAPDGRAEFLVYLRDQADLSAAYAITDWAERGRYVFRTLIEHAGRSQRELRSAIAVRGLSARALWIVNAIRVRGNAADAQALAARADVALVRANRRIALDPLEAPASPDLCSPDAPGNPICWNIRMIGADRVWRDFGVAGQGIVVANIDTGVSYRHPALAPRYRGYRAPGSFDHDYNWFDPENVWEAPYDAGGHGTHTIGTIVAEGQPAVGVAPAARWIAAQGCESFFCSEADLIESAQWMLAPTQIDGTRPRPDLRPMIVNNSWGGSNSPWYAGYTAAWRASGIFPVFAAGNASGIPQVCGTILSPGDYPDVVAVGAVDSTGTIAPFSLLGPASDRRLKPDFVAPGTYLSQQLGLLSTYIGDGASYRALQGTSMATPHVAGLVALLWSANPALIGDYAATYALIRDTAHERSDTRCGDAPDGPNNVYGHGRIDAYAAVARARVNVPWMDTPTALASLAPGQSASFEITLDARRVPGPGRYRARLQIFGADLTRPLASVNITLDVTPVAGQTSLSGRITSADTGAPIAATVSVQGGLGVIAYGGDYTLTLAPGTYDLLATAPSFLPARRRVTLSSAGATVNMELRPDLPRIAVATGPLSATLGFAAQQQLSVPIANTGVRPLAYRARLPEHRYGIWRSDEPGGPAYRWIDLPANARSLDLGDDDIEDAVPLGITFPFSSFTITQTLVSSNGTLGFSMPSIIGGLVNRCLPAGEIYFYMIAPFRADLDPARGGKVRYATLPGSRIFVLSYENVPLHEGPLEATYTFQVLLHDDGRIVFQYRNLAALPPVLSVGVQHTPLEFQQVACGADTPLDDRLAIELRPQLPSSAWISMGAGEQGSLPPGGQGQVGLRLHWIRAAHPQPYRGTLEILSDDPIRPVMTVPIELHAVPARYERWVIVLQGAPW